ncbi:MAG: heme A synthase, partial [Ilumatobacteraceae bacterium]
QGHMLLSQALVAVAVVLLRRAGEPDGERHRVVTPVTSRLTWVLAALTGVAIVAGTVVTGAGPHAGDEDVQRFGVDIADAARVHGTTVLIAIALAVGLALHLQRRPEERAVLQTAVSSWIFVGLLQAAIGYVQYFNDVPELLVGLHVAGATALWSMTVWLVLSTSSCVSPVTSAGRAASDGLVPSRST